MDLLCLVGTGLGLACALFPSIATVLSLLLLHVSYLSLVTVGGTFMHFQWDILLLETGALAILAAPFWTGQQETPLPRVNTLSIRDVTRKKTGKCGNFSQVGDSPPLFGNVKFVRRKKLWVILHFRTLGTFLVFTKIFLSGWYHG